MPATGRFDSIVCAASKRLIATDFWFGGRRGEPDRRLRWFPSAQPNIIENAAVETASVTSTMMTASSFMNSSAISLIAPTSPSCLLRPFTLHYCNGHADGLAPTGAPESPRF